MKLFKDLPNTDTPINAENLNQIQDNLVVVSKTEPTGDNREKVWMQKGKNLFDKNNPNSIFSYIDTTNNIFNEQEDAKSVYVKIRPNTTYTISKTSGKTFRVATSEKIPQKNVAIISTVANHTGNSVTINAGSNANYLLINYYNATNGDTANEYDIRNSIQVEQGSTATEYEAYIEPKMYVKNDNDVYEEFYKSVIKIGSVVNPDNTIFQIENSDIKQINNIVFVDLSIKLLKDIPVNTQFNFAIQGVNGNSKLVFPVGIYGTNKWVANNILYAFYQNNALWISNQLAISKTNGYWKVHFSYWV